MSRKNGNWTILETEKIFENDFFTVREDKVIQPDGKNGAYATIDYKAGVSVLPIDEADFVYLTRQFRYALGRDDLEAASGAIEDEKPPDAARRELLEELGIEAKNWTELGKVENDTSITNSTTHLFAARDLTFKKPHREGTEEIEIIKMPFDEAVKKVTSGEITHGQTCVLILKEFCRQKDA